jgi:hypothetical protein
MVQEEVLFQALDGALSLGVAWGDGLKADVFSALLDELAQSCHVQRKKEYALPTS